MKKDLKERIRQKSIKELEIDLKKRQKDLVEVKFKLVQGQLKDVHSAAKIRREISLIKTILTEKGSKKKKGK